MRRLPNPAYYGKGSHRFWDCINRLPKPNKQTAYALGVALQNVEGDIRRLIENEICNAKRKRR